MIYDLIIIGSGPAGVSAAKILSHKMSVLIIERGKDMNRRRDLTSGWFGHGLYTMKLENDPLLKNKKAIDEAMSIIKKVSPSSSNFLIGKNLAEYYFNCLNKNVDIIFNTEVEKILPNGNIFTLKTQKKDFQAKFCLIATGRNSMDWIKSFCNDYKIKPVNKNIKIGVRVEVPTFKINDFIPNVEDIRTNSFVGEWEDSNILSAFGHEADGKSSKTNFVVCKKQNINALREVKIVNVLQNDKIRPERVKDYLDGKTNLEHLNSFNFKKSLNNLETIFPSFTSYAIMYAPEVRLQGILPVNSRMKTPIKGIFAAGECTSRVCSILGALASGIIAGKNIRRNYEKK